MVTVIIDSPLSINKCNKSVGEFIITKFPPLSKYMYIPGNTRDYDPIVYLNKPFIKEKTPYEDRVEKICLSESCVTPYSAHKNLTTNGARKT